MPIQNIQGLVNKNGLSYVTNGEFINYYYNEGLANLGQRNVSDTVLKNITFKVKDLFNDIKTINTRNQDPYLYIICKYDENSDEEKFYTIKNTLNIDADNVNELIDIIERIQIGNTDDLTELIIQNNENISNENFYVLLNKKLNIIAELFDIIRKENKHEDNYNINTLFIPVDYEFGYIANGINEYIIYSSFKDVYVDVMPVGFSSDTDDYELENLTLYKSNIFYFTEHKYIKTDVYDYYFTAETNDELLIYCKKFTLPYIDDDDYWHINNQKTTIQAKAHDAINLNIILAYYYMDSDEGKYEFLSGLNNVFANKVGMNSEAYEFYVKGDSGLIKCGIKTPKINNESLTKENIELNKVLSNSTLVIISKLSDIVLDKESLNDDKYRNGYITTLWHYNSDEGHKQFECICLDGYALDFNQMTNFENLLKYEIKHIDQIKPHNFLFSYVIFNHVHKELKQDTSKITYYYPVLQNIMSGKYDPKYNNDMNFSLKYINNIIRDKDGINIIDISDQLDIKYLKISSEAQTTNALYTYVINNKINNYNEFIPNYNIPIFDMSEFLIKDSNVMNKYNILTFTSGNDIYYSYIGTSKDTDKNILTIGSSNLNINLGENTLTDANTKQKFKIQDTLDIDFDTINANGKLNVKNDLTVNGDINVMKLEWLITNINNIESKSTVIVPQFKYYKFGNEFYKIINVNNLENDIKQISIDAQQQQLSFGSDDAKYYLYVSPILMVPNSPINNMTYYYKYNDLLVLPNLVKYLGLNINDINTFESNTNEIIKVGTQSLYLVSSNNILSDSMSIVNTTDTGPNIEISNSKEIYSGNTLYITYIKSQKKLIVNEVQSHKVKSIWKIPTNIN